MMGVRDAPQKLLGALIVGLGIALLAAGCGAGETKTVTVSPHTTPVLGPTFPHLLAADDSGIVRIEAHACAGEAIGTGFLIAPRLVATVDHVVAGATDIVLKHEQQMVATGKVIGEDEARDVALVESSKPISGHLFKLSTRAPEVGENVAAIGFPLGLPLTVTKGSVSGLKREIPINGITRKDLVQTDAAVNHGNSGGPVISQETGEVVGLVDLGTTEANGIAFAVSAEVASPLISAWRVAPQPTPASTCGEPQPPNVLAGKATTSGSEALAIVNRYWEEIENHSFASAYADLAPGTAGKTESEFIESEREAGIKHVTFAGKVASISSSQATIDVVSLVTDDTQFGCRTWSGSYTVVEEGSGWLISDAAPHSC